MGASTLSRTVENTRGVNYDALVGPFNEAMVDRINLDATESTVDESVPTIGSSQDDDSQLAGCSLSRILLLA